MICKEQLFIQQTFLKVKILSKMIIYVSTLCLGQKTSQFSSIPFWVFTARYPVSAGHCQSSKIHSLLSVRTSGTNNFLTMWYVSGCYGSTDQGHLSQFGGSRFVRGDCWVNSVRIVQSQLKEEWVENILEKDTVRPMKTRRGVHGQPQAVQNYSRIK